MESDLLNNNYRFMKKQYDFLIIGAGLFGSVFAHLMKEKGKKCLVIDKRTHAGGNVYCRNVDGINVHEYGAHIFHTDQEEIWEFVNKHVTFNRFTNSPLVVYKDQLYNLPFNMNTFNKLWGVITPEEAKVKIAEQCAAYGHIVEPKNLEEQALKFCGDEIYNLFIKGYTEKQWGCAATDLPAFIIKRIPFRFTYDNNYFTDKYQGVPKGGYNKLIKSLLEGIELNTGTNYFDDRPYFDALAEKTLYTGCIDEYFNYEYGRLEYRSLSFEHQTLEIKDFQGNAVVNYTEKEIPYTRVIEHKHFEFGQQHHTVITKEYPKEYTSEREAYYPINNDFNMQILSKYHNKAITVPNLLLGGRLAQYAYFDMDDTIKAASDLSKKALL